jgi:hypothetical protein
VLTRIATVAAALALAVPAAAQERPAEEELFGAPAAAPAPAEPAAPPPAPEGVGRDDAILGGAPAAPAGVLSAAQENPLAIGGQAYLRASTAWYRSTPPADWPLASPNLLDLYADARPNDRVRAFGLVRTSWDPLATGTPLPGTTSAGPDPRAVLDQLWINFDVGRRVFVTAGKQHVKWGVGRFWNPTDFLHPVRRDPLAVFDARTGATMVKVHVPWEARGWNFYGVALLDDPAGQGDAASTVGGLAGGGRAEVVIGTAELGADALFRRGQRPRFGLDFSAGVWDLDVHGEVALRTSSDVQLWEEVDPAADVLGRYGKATLDGVTAQAVLGVSYEVNYSDEDAVRFGAEYFYNGLGYDDAHIYPWLLFDGSFASAFGVDPALLPPALAAKTNDLRAFYVGRHYAGVYVLLAAPGSLNDHTFTLSAIANASDGSAVVRLDHSVLVNTYLTVESFLAGNVGKEGGEFRFSLDLPADVGGLGNGRIRTAPPVLSGGVALRVKL